MEIEFAEWSRLTKDFKTFMSLVRGKYGDDMTKHKLALEVWGRYHG